MNNVLFVANDGFEHGSYKFNKPGDQAVMPEHVAQELQAAGLGVIKTKPRMANKMLPDSLGNADGAGASSASSRQAPLSTSTTLNQSGSGKTLSLRNTK
jgi:hypothetical protein